MSVTPHLSLGYASEAVHQFAAKHQITTSSILSAPLEQEARARSRQLRDACYRTVSERTIAQAFQAQQEGCGIQFDQHLAILPMSTRDTFRPRGLSSLLGRPDLTPQQILAALPTLPRQDPIGLVSEIESLIPLSQRGLLNEMAALEVYVIAKNLKSLFWLLGDMNYPEGIAENRESAYGLDNEVYHWFSQNTLGDERYTLFSFVIPSLSGEELLAIRSFGDKARRIVLDAADISAYHFTKRAHAGFASVGLFHYDIDPDNPNKWAQTKNCDLGPLNTWHDLDHYTSPSESTGNPLPLERPFRNIYFVTKALEETFGEQIAEEIIQEAWVNFSEFAPHEVHIEISSFFSGLDFFLVARKYGFTKATLLYTKLCEAWPHLEFEDQTQAEQDFTIMQSKFKRFVGFKNVFTNVFAEDSENILNTLIDDVKTGDLSKVAYEKEIRTVLNHPGIDYARLLAYIDLDVFESHYGANIAKAFAEKALLFLEEKPEPLLNDCEEAFKNRCRDYLALSLEAETLSST